MNREVPFLSNALPPTWTWSTVGDLTDVVRGASPRPKGDPRYFGGTIPWIMIADVTRQPGKYLYKTREGVTQAGAERSRLLSAGELILSNSGTVCVPKILRVDGCIHDGFVAFPQLSQYVDLEFAYYWFEYIRPTVVDQNRQGITQVNLNTQIVRDLPFPLAARDAQLRVVQELEQQLSRLDAAVASLESAQRKLKAYRASVLKAAVEGRLVPTEAELARTEGRSYEPANVLIHRILKERRRRWEEAELAKMKAAGKTPKDDRWKAKYKEPDPPDADNLPGPPEGWCWATTGQLFSFVTSGSRGWAQYYSQSGPTFLRIGNLDHDSISLDLSDIQHVSPPSGAEGTRTRVVPGDVLISITADVGMVAVVPDEIGEAYISQHISLARPVAGLNIHYLAWFLASAYGGQRQFLALQRGATKVGLGLDDIRGVSVPIPPLVEQGRIVDEIERRLSVAAQCVSDSTASRRRIRRLRQAILRSAFEGKLVDQDPADEPGDVLLARIRAEREAAAVAQPRANRARKLKVAS